MTSKSRYRLFMAGPILLVLLNAWIANRALSKLFSAQDWLAHTLQVRTQAEEVYLSMSTANSAARAYLLTGSREFSQRYSAATQSVYQGTDRLQGLTGDNKEQQARISVLREAGRAAILPGNLHIRTGIAQAAIIWPLQSVMLQQLFIWCAGLAGARQHSAGGAQ